MPPLLMLILLRVGLGRLVYQTGELPHDPECTESIGVTRGEED